MDVPLVAGSVSTAIFAASMLPMVLKAARTKDLGSYSLGNIALINLGNVVHTLYVLTLPAGPVWVLHGLYLVSSALMLLWCLRYRSGAPGAPRRLPALHLRPGDREDHAGAPGGGVRVGLRA
ncbi:hypothetical protein [Georgenia daeguensis]|uniref:PQ-loop repeat-containing protein n=1 Tax=Georgenia daeguensis TaxID=908355 RepID=A0ABP8EY49_9MICO